MEKLWLEKAIKETLKFRHLNDDEKLKLIMQFVETYEVMKEI